MILLWFALGCSRVVWEVDDGGVAPSPRTTALTPTALLVQGASGKVRALDVADGAPRWSEWGTAVAGAAPGAGVLAGDTVGLYDDAGVRMWKAPARAAAVRADGPVLLEPDGLSQRDWSGKATWWVPGVAASSVVVSSALVAARVDGAGWWSLFGHDGRAIGVIASPDRPVAHPGDAGLAYGRADGTFVLLDGAGRELRTGDGAPLAIGWGRLVVDAGSLDVIRLSDGVTEGRIAAAVSRREGAVALCGAYVVWHRVGHDVLLASPVAGGAERTLARGGEPTVLVCDDRSVYWASEGRIGRTDF
jgi:hypothetical protein